MESTQEKLAYYKKCLRNEQRAIRTARILIPIWKVIAWFRVPGSKNRLFYGLDVMTDANYGLEEFIQTIDKIERYGFYPIMAVGSDGSIDMVDIESLKDMAVVDEGYDGWLSPDDTFSR